MDADARHVRRGAKRIGAGWRDDRGVRLLNLQCGGNDATWDE